jgi:hypothetical protein
MALTEDDLDDREKLIARLAVDPRLAHQFLFAHRHPQATPPFHYEIIDDLHGDHPRIIELAFRGAAKSTLAEEAIVIDACFKRFRNLIIVGENFTRASERLAAIKHELEYNEPLEFLFGNLRGPVWNEDKIELANGTVVQAFGRGQSLRGTKHGDARPDACLIDDLEDEESVATPEGRDKVLLWVMRTLLPALAPGARVRMLANLLDPDCLAMRLERTGTWLVRRYPWQFISRAVVGADGTVIDPGGARKASWPARFSLEHIDRTRAEHEAAGTLNEYMQEYMVQAVDPSSRVFTADMFRIVPRLRTWEPCFAMYDPARTVKASSSLTGKVVFSWVGQKLIIWEADGQHWMPDQIVADIFDTAQTYAPIRIGVEKEGLEEFLLQPIRSEMTRRHCIIPVEAMPAPVGKLAFIRSLQPYFSSGHIECVREFPALFQQLLSYPTGKNDTINALAYALRMRPGLPIYSNFGFKNVVDDAEVISGADCALALNASRQYLAGVLVQRRSGVTFVLRDWLVEGDPGGRLGDLAADARLAARGETLNVFAPPVHFRGLDTIGLGVAARRFRFRLGEGGQPVLGRDALRNLVDRTVGDVPALVVSTRARWTLNALAGGYSGSLGGGGKAYEFADEGPYKVLMEGLESLIAVAYGAGDGEPARNYAVDPRGRRYLSARAMHHGQGGTEVERAGRRRDDRSQEG